MVCNWVEVRTRVRHLVACKCTNKVTKVNCKNTCNDNFRTCIYFNVVLSFLPVKITKHYTIILIYIGFESRKNVTLGHSMKL